MKVKVYQEYAKVRWDTILIISEIRNFGLLLKTYDLKKTIII